MLMKEDIRQSSTGVTRQVALLSKQRFLVIHELHSLPVIHVREERPGEVVVVPAADVGAVELLGDGNAAVETDL